jgi:NAD+ synthase (glutamine-hydrolysing)
MVGPQRRKRSQKVPAVPGGAGAVVPGLKGRLVVATAALNLTPLAWESNLAAIDGALTAARLAGARLVCLPELCITGYGCEDAFHSSAVAERALQYAQSIAKAHPDIVFSLGLPLLLHGVVYNSVALVAGGAIRGFAVKQELAGDGLHYEPRWFKPWRTATVSQCEVGGATLPVGDLLFEIDGVRIGFEICEDAWVAERVAGRAARYGVDIILNPSASHFAFGKHEIRARCVLEGSRACGAAYLYANLLGCEAGRVLYDGDVLIAAHGELVARSERFSFKPFDVVCAEIDLDRARLGRRRSAAAEPQYDLGARRVVVSVPLASAAVSRSRTLNSPAPSPEGLRWGVATAAWERSECLQHEEFTRAVALGLFDYLRKSQSHGFVVSLSGGVDSSAISVLVGLMVEEAIAQVGLPTFKRVFSYIPWMAQQRSAAQIVENILACVYQRSENSSKITEDAARHVATEIGATFVLLDVAHLVRGYEELIERALSLTLTWAEHDLVRQNVQARVRSPSVWMVANLRRSLLLSTSNRSEAAVGYTTMDGDCSGGLSPLGGIDKAYLRRWLLWMEQHGPRGLRKFSSLALVNQQQPTAELRPLAAGQTDEGDLMPYIVLDRIERLAVRDKLLPLDVSVLIQREFEGVFAPPQIDAWVGRFFELWSINQWKRERYAPSFHLDDESVDPKTWCRFPILSGGFRLERKELTERRTPRPSRRRRR